MRYSNTALEELADSVDLLHMLERLTAGLSTESGDSNQLPWGGIQLTLSQIREKVTNAHRAVAASASSIQTAVTEEKVAKTVLGGAMAQPAKRVANSPLAGRIQMSPAVGTASVGRTREIGVSTSGE